MFVYCDVMHYTSLDVLSRLVCAMALLLLSLNEAVTSINVKVTHIWMTDFCYFNRALHRRGALVFQSKTFLLMDTKILKLNIITR